MLARLLLVLITGMFWLSIAGVTAAAARGPLEFSAAFIVNSANGLSSEECRISGEIQDFGKNDLSIEILSAKSDSIRCGSGSLADYQGTAGDSLLIANVSVGAWLGQGTLTVERLANVNLSFAVDDVPGREQTGLRGDEPFLQERKMLIGEGQVMFIPVWVVSNPDEIAHHVQELFLKIALERNRKDSNIHYGALTVRSGDEGGALYLDGGLLGIVTSKIETSFPNLHAGLRALELRTESGQSIQKAVRIQRGRAVRANFSVAALGRQQGPFELDSLGKNAQGYEEYRRSRDQAVVVEIPAGQFLMGNKETERSPLEHEVYVSTFLMDKLGVTWAQYRMYAEAAGRPMPPRDPYWGMPDDHPAVFVTWDEAKAYCEWAGARLPTEAEREKAARGTDQRMYPWGNEAPDPKRAVFRRAWGFDATAAVGTHPAGISPYGLHDMGGNVWEWCSDWYDDDYFAVSPLKDPKGPASGNAHVLRGGSWDSRPDVLSASCRNWGRQGYREGDFGFRCAMDAPAD